MTRRVVVLTLSVIVGLTWAIGGDIEVASAQQRQPSRYSPPSGRPTVSPYLNLYRFNAGSPLPNYYSLVRPEFKQLDTNRQQSTQIRNQESEVRTLQRDVLQLRQPTARQTGIGASHGNYSHFYQRPQAGR